MEKNIVDYFKRVLSLKNGHLSMNSFKGHMAELSQKERKHIKKVGLEKLLNKFTKDFVLCDDEIYLIIEEKEEIKPVSPVGKSKGTAASNVDKPSMVDLQSSEDDPCTVCSDKIEIFAIGECRHPICFRCSTKLRVLCEDKNCPVCRQTLEMVVFCKKLMPMDEHDIDSYVKDKKHGIAFESPKICEQKGALLRHVCTNCQPNVTFDAFPSLEDHARSKHHLFYCEICVRQCKIFTDERKTYSKTELSKHMEYGDEVGSARGGHPLCMFCNTRYLDSDELHRHLRLHHCSCPICDEENEGTQNYQFYVLKPFNCQNDNCGLEYHGHDFQLAGHYYYSTCYKKRDREALVEHQWDKHYICKEPECIDIDCPVAFRNEIDLQSHNLQKHSKTKSKLEKRQEQIISVPLMYEGRSQKQQRILKVTPDAAGGINCTGTIARRIERGYSFIERDDAPLQFEENVFFDLEACGLEASFDLREIFVTGDRVSAYAIPGNKNSKSKWKALKVERMEILDEEHQYYFHPYAVPLSQPKEQLQQNDFPVLSPRFPQQDNPSVTLPGWSVAARNKPARPAPMSLQAYSRKENAAVKANYKTGYVHKNLADKYGFITKEKYTENFSENVYFNTDAFRVGMGIYEPIEDLRNVLQIGEKVFYTLHQHGALYQNVKTKLRADRVWRSSTAAAIPEGGSTAAFNSIRSNGIGNTSRPREKVKASGLEGIDLEALAHKYKMRLQIQADQRGASLSQDSDISTNSLNLPNGGLTVSDIPGATDVSRELRNRMQAKSSAGQSSPIHHVQQPVTIDRESLNQNKNPSASLLMKLAKIPDQTTDKSYSSAEDESAGEKSPAYVHGKHADSNASDFSSSNEMYSSEEESDGDDEDDLFEMSDSDVMYENNTFVLTIEICLKNKGFSKMLRKQMSKVMKSHGVNKPSNLQFLEFRKDGSKVYMMFFVSAERDFKDSSGDTTDSSVEIASAQYVKLEGLYPLESSWLGELKSMAMVKKVSRDLYHIPDSGHYITVQRKPESDKISKVIVHYRPTIGER